MIFNTHCAARHLLICLITLCLIPGCHNVQETKRSDAEGNCCSAEMMIVPEITTVTVIGDAAPRELLHELEFLAAEIRNGLAAKRGLRLLESPSICAPDCLANSAVPRALPETSGIQPADFSLPVPGQESTGEIYLPRTSPECRLLDPIEVRVSIDDFVPYRPMVLGATISVRNAATGEEILLIQKTWQGRDDYDPVADASCALQRSLKRPGSRVELEEVALGTLSPRRFLRNVARQLIPEIYGSCVPRAGMIFSDEIPVIESDW